MAETSRVEQHLDGGDPAAGHREGHHGLHLAADHHHDPGGAVDQRRPHERRQLGGQHGLTGHLARAVDDDGPPGPPGAAVGAQHHLRIEDRDQRVEIAVPGRGEERVHHFALLGQIGIRRRRLAPHPPAGPARELPGRGR